MNFDNGYQFGIGAFETMVVQKGRILFVKEHIKRLNDSLKFLNIDNILDEGFLYDQLQKNIVLYEEINTTDKSNTTDEINTTDKSSTTNKSSTTDEINTNLGINIVFENTQITNNDYFALKVMVSDKNIIFKTRDISYNKEDYVRGYKLGISKILRNPTSPLVFHKTFHYGENWMEKQKATKQGFDDMLFINIYGEIAETTCCNIFFVKDECIYTPKITCGLLPGVIRGYLCKNFEVVETIIKEEELGEYDECFITNSLVGVMPVKAIKEFKFTHSIVTSKVSDYLQAHQ